MILVIGMVLDALLGEPRWLWSRAPHPAVLMGRVVGWLDRTLNHGAARRGRRGLRARGVLAVVGLVAGGALSGGFLSALGDVVQVLAVAVLVAQRSLVDHVRAVAAGLRMSPDAGRRAVAMIVGRDTAGMQPPDIARAAIESAAENLSDGVVAPVFWFAVAGLPGLVIYKVVNTADSMIGHRTPRHLEFGWAAARLDDVLNLLPARLTALLIVAGYGLWGAWRDIVAEARLHRSPNAGWPEAAMARALNVALSGPRSYHGVRQDFPFVNATGQRDIGAAQVDAACAALWRTWALTLALILALTLLLALVTG